MKLLTTKEAAQLTGLTKNQLNHLVRQQHIPHYNLGPRTTRFSESELLDWLQRRAVPACQKQNVPEDMEAIDDLKEARLQRIQNDIDHEKGTSNPLEERLRLLEKAKSQLDTASHNLGTALGKVYNTIEEANRYKYL